MNMNERLMTAARLLKDSWALMRSTSLPSGLRYEIALSDARLRMLAATGKLHQDRPVKLLNYLVKPCVPETLLYVFQEIFVDLNYLFRTSNERPVILDCGSNIGLSILFFKTLFPEAQIVGFEPEPRTFARLEENVSNNGLSHVSLNRAAVGRENGVVEFFFDPREEGSPMASTDARRIPNGVAERVPQVRLSDFVNGPVDYLKLDVEGAELAVLEDLADTGALRNIDQLVVECHHHIDPDEDSLSKILAILEAAKFGYQVDATCFPSWRERRGRAAQDVVLYAYRK
jgi:FkbM family methyltransferase